MFSHLWDDGQHVTIRVSSPPAVTLGLLIALSRFGHKVHDKVLFGLDVRFEYDDKLSVDVGGGKKQGNEVRSWTVKHVCVCIT